MSAIRHRWLLAAATVVVAVLVAAGCGSKTSGGSTSASSDLAKDQTLTINIAADVNSLDPAKFNDVDSLNTTNMLFVGLYRFMGSDAHLEPWLATALPTATDNGLTQTVKIRDDAKWSDGTKVTSADVKYGIERAMKPETKSPWAGFMAPIKSLDTPDATTVVFHLSKSIPWFNGLLAINSFYPVPKQAIDKYGDKWTEPGNIVTNGPFTLKEWKHGSSMTMAKASNFYGADKVKLQTIKIVMVPEAKVAIRQFEQGQIDTGFLRRMIPPSDIDKWKNDPRYRSVDSTSTNYVWFNTTNVALKDPKVRQGLAMAIDRKAMVDQITRRGDHPLNTVIPTPLPGYDTIRQGANDFLSADGSPDINKAKDLLKQGGWKDGTTLTYYYTSSGASGEAIATQVQSDLSKVGVKVKLVNIPDGAALYDAAKAPVDKKIDMVALGWAADYLDAQDYYQLWTCDGIKQTVNASNYCNKDYDAKYNTAIATTDETERFKLYRDIEAKLTGANGDMPAAPLYQPKDDTVVQNWVKGIEITPASTMYFENAEVRQH